jgi:four helix bundle protein
MELGAESKKQRVKSREQVRLEMSLFRFENLVIWKRAVDVARKLFRLADILEERKLYRFAQQIRGAGLSMPNNIAEGSGSTSKREFLQFLNIARRSTFENASMIMVFAKDGLIPDDKKEEIVQELNELCRMITAFSRTLRSKENGTKSKE